MTARPSLLLRRDVVAVSPPGYGHLRRGLLCEARKADLDDRVHFHTPRHTTGSWLAMRGMPMQQIQIILGHSDSKVTERYSHLAPETLDRAMEETFGE